uniref:Mitochondrial outer membrane protein OM14 C-terminal domain-containing protein n=1 Tax=Bionectria ochroleuca TaxID=29856 RepID=A0A0B7JSZ3_BIOOC
MAKTNTRPRNASRWRSRKAAIGGWAQVQVGFGYVIDTNFGSAIGKSTSRKRERAEEEQLGRQVQRLVACSTRLASPTASVRISRSSVITRSSPVCYLGIYLPQVLVLGFSTRTSTLHPSNSNPSRTLSSKFSHLTLPNPSTTMSYADVAASGPKQSPEEAAAPQPPQVITDESASTASLIDVDLPSVHTAWGLYQRGSLSWKDIGIGAGVVAGVGAVESVVGRYLYKTKKDGSS